MHCYVLGKNNDFDYHHRLLDSTFVPSERLELEARLAVVRDQPKVALDILSRCWNPVMHRHWDGKWPFILLVQLVN